MKPAFKTSTDASRDRKNIVSLLIASSEYAERVKDGESGVATCPCI